jgi:hypothetical protein
VFLLNSCLSLFAAAIFRWHPLSRSYGAILPSSLTMLLPSALGFSPQPPVSVYGTGTMKTIAAFLGTWLTHFPTFISVRITSSGLYSGFAICTPTSLTRSFPFCACALHMRPHSSVSLQYRNLNLLSIGYGFRPHLRPRLTQGRSALPWKPWLFGREDSHLPLATHSGILSSIHSTAPSGTASSRIQCSSTDAFQHP